MPKLVHAVPKYAKHKASGQAIVRFNGEMHYLGPYGSAKSIDKYDQLVARYLAKGRSLPKESEPVSVAEVAAAFLAHAETYYVKDGRPTSELGDYRRVIKTLLRLYVDLDVSDFGPLALKACRQLWVDQGMTRLTVNKNQGRLVRMFKWGVGEEIVPSSVWESLRSVPGLRKGRTTAKEPNPIMPVGLERVQPTIEHLSSTLRAMVRMQLLTGMRPGEVCIMRPCDVDRSGDVWEYRPGSHKTEHHGRTRTIYLGPEAQIELRPFLLRGSDQPCFSPAESMEWFRQQAEEGRQTPAKYGNARGRKRDKRVPSPNTRIACAKFTTGSYGAAIRRACLKAWPVPKEIKGDAAAVKAWEREHAWRPNQLRHTRATEIRQRFGLEAAQVILGHATADVTQIYAERDAEKAREVARTIG